MNQYKTMYAGFPKIHHVGIVCRSPSAMNDGLSKILAVNQLQYREVGLPGTFLGTATDVWLEFRQVPIIDNRIENQSRLSTIDYIALTVAGVVDFASQLAKSGNTVIDRNSAPRPYLETEYVLLDPNGLPIRLIDRDSRVGKMEPICHGGEELMFHHLSLITPDLRQTQKFYIEQLGFKTLFEHVRDDGGFVFLVDGEFDPNLHNVMIEVIGPPYLEPREAQILKEQGACYDHYCFIAQDVQGAFKRAIASGGIAVHPPYRDYGHWIAWIGDPEGNSLEFMSPIPEEVIEFALESPLETGEFVFDAGKPTEKAGGRLVND